MVHTQGEMGITRSGGVRMKDTQKFQWGDIVYTASPEYLYFVLRTEEFIIRDVQFEPARTIRRVVVCPVNNSHRVTYFQSQSLRRATYNVEKEQWE